MSDKTSTASSRLPHRSRSLWGRLRIGFAWALLAVIPVSSHGVIRTSPSDNNGTAVAHGALLGASIGGTLSGFATPFPFSIGFEAIALGSDLGLKNTPPILEVPGSFSVNANSTSSVIRSHHSCVYRFDEPIQREFDDDYAAGVEEGYASVWGIPFDQVDDNFGDLGKPAVYHAYADVSVRAEHPYLAASGYQDLWDSLNDGDEQTPDSDLSPALINALRKNPEFPEGRHKIQWQATTSMNGVMDIGVPSALFAFSSLAEFKLAQRAKVVAARKAAGASVEAQETFLKRADFILDVFGVAEELGLTTADVTSAGQAEDWYKRTSFETGTNRTTQTLTVWDINSPRIIDAETYAPLNGSQSIVLEATDFGGVRLGRVREALQENFRPIDNCAKRFSVTSEAPDSLLLKIDQPNSVDWDARELNGGPYRDTFSLRANQSREGENLVTHLTQNIVVVDTQAPILVPPPGFARYSDMPVSTVGGGFPLGRPLVVDLADSSPEVTNDAPPQLEVDRRYSVFWQAADASGNSTAAGPFDPARYTQVVTIKSPGTNTPPTAAAQSASTTTSNGVEILLEGSDNDIIDGIADPLAFEIDQYPANGEFEAPLLPYFINDYRLTPEGEREEGDELTRTSPLKHLADEFRLLSEQERRVFLSARICNAVEGQGDPRDFAEFGRSVPRDFVYRPRTVLTDDDKLTFIRDGFWACVITPAQSTPVAKVYGRISKWSDVGEFLGMQSLQFSSSSEVVQPPYSGLQPTSRLQADHNDRLWIGLIGENTFGLGRSETFYTLSKDLDDFQEHGRAGYDDRDFLAGRFMRAITGDTRFDLLYEMHDLGQAPAPPGNELRVRVLNGSQVDLASSDGYIGVIRSGAKGVVEASDIKVDSTGAVYVSDSETHRLHKYSATTRNAAGEWELGQYLGWLGSCTGNLLNAAGVEFNACDVQTQTSRGFACTDEKCARAADPKGSAQGQFDSPGSLAIDPRDIIYVADTENFRVQRFGTDGTFAGVANSTGTGINQGTDPGFVLGNMGKPGKVTVNSSSFYVMESQPQNGDFFVHVFKTLPFYDVTDNSAKVTYVSDFDFQGTDSFTYYTDDGIDRSAPALVDVSVSRTFRAPYALRSECFASVTLSESIPCSLDEDSEIFVRLSASDFDGFASAGGLDVLDFNVEVTPESGSLTAEFATDNAQVFRYVPAADAFGTDSFEFVANDGDKTSAERGRVELTVTPMPDPVSIDLPDDLLAARGFPLAFSAEYSDVDKDPEYQSPLLLLTWGDGGGTQPGDWINSGRFDANQREIDPQFKLADGSGRLIGSHTYASAGRYALSVTMDNQASLGLNPTNAITTVDVIEATVLQAELASPAEPIDPDVDFPLTIDVTNLQPEFWSGLSATNTVATLEVPDGLTLVTLDGRCLAETPIRCSLGTLNPGATEPLQFTARVALDDARESSAYVIEVQLTDNGPKVRDKALAFATVEVADSDSDGRFDVEDAFPNDDRYFADSDGDGLPDAWELLYGLDPNTPDATDTDTDGDGFTLAEEFAQTSFPELAEQGRMLAKDVRQAPLAGRGDDLFGLTLAGADLNLDGYADTLIGAPAYGDNGAVFIANGGPEGVAKGYRELQPLDDLPVSLAGFGFGRRILATDLTGNDYPDVVIADNSRAWVHLNNGEILSLHDLILDPIGGTAQANLQLVAGDLDGDNVDDLVISGQIPGGATRIQVYHSDNDGPTGTPDEFIMALDQVTALAIADIDGDGLNDLLAGSGSGSGQVRGYLGNANNWRAGAPLVESFALLPEPTWSRFGFSMASNGDINGDGIDDLVVGAYGGVGRAIVYDSRTNYWLPGGTYAQILTGTDDGTSPGDTHPDQFGLSVALDHFDRDEFADVAVGANRAGNDDEGEVRILRGSVTNLRTDNQQASLGPADWGLLGYGIAAVGDIDGDGVADLAVGAPNIDTLQSPPPTGGYVQFFYHGFEALNPAEDPDNDGVRSAIDNCAMLANTAQADLDGDGAGDDCDVDADGDGLDSEWERVHDLDPLSAADADLDSDGDGLSNREEFTLGTAPNQTDTDHDGIADDVEIARGSDPLFGDTDGDGIANSDEDDDDADGLSDSFELGYGLSTVDGNDALGDLDGDGFSNLAERNAGSALDDLGSMPDVPTAATQLFASVLPGHRATVVGQPVTAFASIVNAGEDMAIACSLVPLMAIEGRWSYTPTDPATNAIDGVANETRDIEAGQTQSYVFEFTPAATMATDIPLWFDCENTDAVQILDGLNTFGITVADEPPVDMVALSATASNDGIVRLPGASGSAAFALASVNVGAAGSLRVEAQVSDGVPAVAFLCETDSDTGLCLNGQTPRAELLLDVELDATPTFSVFVTAQGEVPLDPASRRVAVRFYAESGAVVGSTSVAITSQ